MKSINTISPPVNAFYYLYYNNHMIEINIPGRDRLTLEHLVLDVNGTLAVDGVLIEGVSQSLNRLRGSLNVHLVTADTHGKQFLIDQQLGLKATRLQAGNESEQKASYVARLGSEKVIAIGQGANDAGMLKNAALGICVLSQESTALSTMLSADLVVPDILTAFSLLEKPGRIIASLRK